MVAHRSLRLTAGPRSLMYVAMRSAKSWRWGMLTAERGKTRPLAAASSTARAPTEEAEVRRLRRTTTGGLYSCMTTWP